MFSVKNFEDYKEQFEWGLRANAVEKLNNRAYLKTIGLRAFLTNTEVLRHFSNDKLGMTEDEMNLPEALDHRIYKEHGYSEKTNRKIEENDFDFLDMKKRVKVSESIKIYFNLDEIYDQYNDERRADTHDYYFVCDIELCNGVVVEEFLGNYKIKNCILKNLKHIESHAHGNDGIYYNVYHKNTQNSSLSHSYLKSRPELCEIIMEYNPMLLGIIPTEVKSREDWVEICIKAFREDITTKNTTDYYLSDDYTNKHCEVFDLPENLWTMNRVKISRMRNDNNYYFDKELMHSCPKSFYSHEFFSWTIDQKICFDRNRNVEKYLSYKLWKKAFENSIIGYEEIPKQFVSEDIVKILIQRNPNAIRFLDNKKLNYQQRYDGLDIERYKILSETPKRKMDYKFCKRAFELAITDYNRLYDKDDYFMHTLKYFSEKYKLKIIEEFGEYFIVDKKNPGSLIVNKEHPTFVTNNIWRVLYKN